MKINLNTLTKNKLLSLNIVKSKIYKNATSSDPIKIKNIVLNLKKALKIIYKYHASQKQIAFIDTSNKLNKQIKYLLSRQTKHRVIPENLWVNGFITQKNSNNKIKTYQNLLRLKQIAKLIVIISNKPNTAILKESYKTKLVTVSLTNNTTIKDNSNYKITGNFKFLEKKTLNNFFYSLLLSILKKNRTQRPARTLNKRKENI